MHMHRIGGALRAAALTSTLLLALALPTLAQTRGGSLTLGVEQDIAGFDPLVVGVYDTGASAVANLLFDTLTRLDDAGAAQPRLALSWHATPDYKTWTFKLRPGVKFIDGSPFNAQAVAFNYEYMQDPKNHCRCAFYISNIAKVEPIDDHTVVFHLRNPGVELPGLLAPSTVTNVIHSPKAIREKGKEYNRQPVGTGPFMLKSWQSGDRMGLVRNPNYWDAGKPYLDQVVIRPLPNATSRFASVLSGDADITWEDDSDNILKAKKDSALTVREFEGSGASVFMVNTKKPPMDDVRVRRAMRMALDMNAFAEAWSQGLRPAAKDPYGPGSFVHCSDPKLLPYDPAGAKKLLQEYGKPVEATFIVTATPRGRFVGQTFQEMWKAVGMKVTLDEVDQTTLVTRALRRDFQIVGWRIIDLADPDPQMYANFHTGSPVDMANYSNPEVDKLLDHARVTADRAHRTKDYCRIAEILNQEVPWFWTTENRYYSISRANVKGVGKQYSDVVDVTGAWLSK